MATGMVVVPLCAACGSPSSWVELVAPGELPAKWQQWDSARQGSFLLRRDPQCWHLIVQGIAACNGDGDPIDVSKAEQIAEAFQPPLSFAQVHTAGLYDDAGFCPDCNAPYCHRHWHVSESGYGHCPHHHGKSLDPHRPP
jgi:hypothetical protein